ncbi:MAG: calcium-binding protein, partial [Thermodesulfobacteriota bacterium]|nr:calcium-binding protein [Thermodesulfobacteriota bacterium]
MGKTNISKVPTSLDLTRVPGLLILGLFLLFPALSHAEGESLCAVVKIEIRQELTLERQGFDAHMRINNGLSHITLEDVDVDVSFADEDGETVLASSDPDDPDPLVKFFIRVDSMENISDVDGAGTVAPSSSADIHWLIIPAPGASNGLEHGALYYVGATLTYTIGGEEQVTEVSPDYIFVKPMPELTLDYFLPSEVYGDDAWTPEIEPPVPFSLGVRVRNNGFGAARNLKIDSAQPQIVENEQGLLIGFVIEGSEVNGQPATESLLVDFGDIEPNASGMARWIMTCTLSGEFVEFDAEFSHSDELGGELTSLIEAVNTHFLVRDVLVDLPGRDDIRDFLGKDGDVFRAYESDSVDTEVLDQSAYSTLQLEGQYGSEALYALSTPQTAGFMFVQLLDPHEGQKVLKEVARSDGKQIKEENFWLSKTRNPDHSWQHFVNLFDVNTTDSYTLVYDEPSAMPQPPVLQFIPDRSGIEGQQLSFIVEASDPN